MNAYRVSQAAFRDMQQMNDAIEEARRRAKASGEPQRVYKAYGVYHIRPMSADWAGRHVAEVQ